MAWAMCGRKPKAPDDSCWRTSQPFAGAPPGAKDRSLSRADAQPQCNRGDAKRVGAGPRAETSPLPWQGQSAIAELFDWSGVQRQTVIKRVIWEVKQAGQGAKLSPASG